MIYCKLEPGDDDGINFASSFATNDATRLVTNPTAFELIEDLMRHSIPLPACYGAELADGVKMKINARDKIKLPQNTLWRYLCRFWRWDIKETEKIWTEICLVVKSKNYHANLF
jgi:hypothetical protein